MDLERATLSLPGALLKDMDDLIGRETEQLAKVLGIAVPIRERDYYPKGHYALAGT